MLIVILVFNLAKKVKLQTPVILQKLEYEKTQIISKSARKIGE